MMYNPGINKVQQYKTYEQFATWHGHYFVKSQNTFNTFHYGANSQCFCFTNIAEIKAVKTSN